MPNYVLFFASAIDSGQSSADSPRKNTIIHIDYSSLNRFFVAPRKADKKSWQGILSSSGRDFIS
jgi:hypothetical protein